jgi:hypothetical protein
VITRANGAQKLQRLGETFEKTINCIHDSLGNKPFHIRAGFNAAAFDAVAVAFAKNLSRISQDVRKRYEKLLQDDEYKTVITSGTTDEEIVHKRIRIAEKILFS